MSWSPSQVIVTVLAGLVVVYLAARLISAAVFKSKQQYEKEKHHGQESTQS